MVTVIAILSSLALPGTAGAVLGLVLGILKNPAAKPAFRIASELSKKLVKGDHLSNEDKKFIKDYNNGMTPRQKMLNSYYGWR
jgi:hypothetical protein